MGRMRGYLELTNRMERVAIGPDGLGYVCLWPYTSKLDIAEVLPRVGKRVLQETLRDNKYVCSNSVNTKKETIEVSVIIGHRGLERLPHLQATLQSVAAQLETSIECIVVEQDITPKIKQNLPEWVHYIFQRSEDGGSGYNRSRAFNYGVRQARGKVVVLHDNDMLMPETYCKEVVCIAQKGYEAMNIKRFVHYLGRNDSEAVMMDFARIGSARPLEIVQNLEAGGSMAITKRGYEIVGGMDESFVGWGGEDNEFWDRCSSLKKWSWGYLSLIHLWHRSQPLKETNDNPNIIRARQLSGISREKRIERLRTINSFFTSFIAEA